MRPGDAILAAAILAMPARAFAAEEAPNRVAFRLEGICRESVSPPSFAGLALSIGTIAGGPTDADRASTSAIGLPGFLSDPSP
jgi:hypothetical protein